MAGTSTASTTDPETTLQIDHTKKGWKIVNDAIFGIIELKPHIVKIIDTVEFQRLRWIWQLGGAPFVYPTADHCRFEHSIGTYHLASKLVRKLQKQVGKGVITDKDVKCVEIAALCHDIGHGPFSHLWDNTVLPNIFPNQEKVKHEDHFLPVWNSKFKDIVNDKVVDQELIMNDDDGKLIAALINGKATEGKEILSTIVSNSESGMDVDKWDYLARDASYLGHSSTNYRIDIDRMIHFARAIKGGDGKWKIAFRKSEGLNMLRVFQFRHYIHKTACYHKTVIAIEQMMLDGFKRLVTLPNAEDTDVTPPNMGGGDLKGKIGTAEWILKNNDSIFWQNVDKISEFKRILERDLYTPILSAVIYKRVEDPTDDIIKYLERKTIKTSKDDINDKTVVNGFRFGFSPFKLSSTESSSPLCNIPFYKDSDPEKICRYTDGSTSSNVGGSVVTPSNVEDTEVIPPFLRYDVDESKITVFEIQSKFDDGKAKEFTSDKALILKALTDYFTEKNDLLTGQSKKWIVEELKKRKNNIGS